MNKLIIANWKMNPGRESEASRLARREDFSNVILAPPFVFLPAVKKAAKKAVLAAQDVFWEIKGAYTGEISVSQLKQVGVKYVIVGHSERRRWLKETDIIINRKLKTVLAAGLKVILCVGEDWSVRKKGLNTARNFVKKQLIKDLAGLENSESLQRDLIIAYEPVWAIGTGRNDKPENAAEIIRFIKTFLNSKVLYGGSINDRNAGSFLNQAVIDGLLVGGVSLKSGEFTKIIKSVGL